MGKLGRIRKLGSKVAKRLRARDVSAPEGEPQATPSAAPAVERTQAEPASTGTRFLSAQAIREAIAATQGPLLVNHWATWCEGCVDELPMLAKLHTRFGEKVRFIGVSWESFQFERPDTVEHVIAFAEAHGAVWDSLLVQDRPEELFEVLEMVCQTIPQILLLDAEGEVVYRCEQVLDEAEFERLTVALEGVLR
jgi:thiol-disulfide isomerase/thioredoxin